MRHACCHRTHPIILVGLLGGLAGCGSEPPPGAIPDSGFGQPVHDAGRRLDTGGIDGESPSAADAEVDAFSDEVVEDGDLPTHEADGSDGELVGEACAPPWRPPEPPWRWTCRRPARRSRSTSSASRSSGEARSLISATVKVA